MFLKLLSVVCLVGITTSQTTPNTQDPIGLDTLIDNMFPNGGGQKPTIPTRATIPTRKPTPSPPPVPTPTPTPNPLNPDVEVSQCYFSNLLCKYLIIIISVL